MTLLQSLTEHYIDAGAALDDGVVTVNGESQFSAHRELVAGDVVEVALDYLPTGKTSWTIE